MLNIKSRGDFKIKYSAVAAFLCLNACASSIGEGFSMKEDEKSNYKPVTISSNLLVYPEKLGLKLQSYMKSEIEDVENIIKERSREDAEKGRPRNYTDEELQESLTRYAFFKSINSLYSRADIINFLENITPEDFDIKKGNEAIVGNCTYENLKDEISFEAQLNRLDLSELEEIVFCWPNSCCSRKFCFQMPLETGCCSNHEIVDLEDIRPKILYADLACGFVHIVGFDIKNLTFWEMVYKKLNGRKISVIKDCSDDNWSELIYLENKIKKGDVTEYISLSPEEKIKRRERLIAWGSVDVKAEPESEEDYSLPQESYKANRHAKILKKISPATRYVKENILKEEGRIECAAMCEEVTVFDFNHFFEKVEEIESLKK